MRRRPFGVLHLALGAVMGALAGGSGCYLTMDWRIGAVEAKANLYMVGAMNAHAQLDTCQKASSPWPRKRGLTP